MDILRMEEVSFSYNQSPFIENLNFGLKEREFVGLVGPNGSGKTTVLKLLAGLLRPHGGRIMLWGRPLQEYTGRDRAKLISYLPQILYTNVPFTVEELVSMGLYPYEIMPQTSIDEALGSVGLYEKRNATLTELSGGEKRRAFIAMTLLQGAGILLLDEPMANLDIRYQIELLCLLRDLRLKRGISILMALHEVGLFPFFDRVVVMNEGRVVTSGPPSEVVTEGLIKQVYGVEIRIHRDARGSISIGLI